MGEIENKKEGVFVFVEHILPFDHRHWSKAQNYIAATVGCFIGYWLSHMAKVPAPFISLILLAGFSAAKALFHIFKTYHSLKMISFMPEPEDLTIQEEQKQIVWNVQENPGFKANCLHLFDDSGYRVFKPDNRNGLDYICVCNPATETVNFICEYLLREEGLIPQKVTSISVCFTK